MWAIQAAMTTLAIFQGSDPPTPDAESRYCDIQRAVARDRGAHRLPWQTFRAFGPQLLRLAEESPRHPAAPAAALAAAEYGSQCLDTCRYEGQANTLLMGRVLDALASRWPDDERVGKLCSALARLPSPAREAFLRRLARESGNPSVRGRARLALAELLKAKLACIESLPEATRADGGARARETWGTEYLDELRASDPATVRTEAEALLERVAREHGRIAFVRGTGETPVWREAAEKDLAAGRTLGMVAEADLDEMLNLAPGRVAPEIEGRDANGGKFRLRDYRGKVVLLTFSGNWCGPCRSMYPYERDLVARRRGQPFALLGVNADEGVATLAESVRAGTITWRCWWDGPPGGPIASRWNIRAWPTTYLIDAEGVIRAKNPGDEALDGLIDGLIAGCRVGGGQPFEAPVGHP